MKATDLIGQRVDCEVCRYDSYWNKYFHFSETEIEEVRVIVYKNGSYILKPDDDFFSDSIKISLEGMEVLLEKGQFVEIVENEKRIYTINSIKDLYGSKNEKGIIIKSRR